MFAGEEGSLLPTCPPKPRAKKTESLFPWGPGPLLTVLALCSGCLCCLCVFLVPVWCPVGLQPCCVSGLDLHTEPLGVLVPCSHDSPAPPVSFLSLTWASIFLPSHHQTRVPVWSRRGRDSRLALTPDTYSWERPPPTPPAQRRNAHRPLHQCMINLPISSLRFHPPSPSPRAAGSGPGPGPLLVSRLLCTVSPRLKSGGWKFLVIQPPPGAIQAPPGEP